MHSSSVPSGDAAAELEDVVIRAGGFSASPSRGARRAWFRPADGARFVALSPAGEAVPPVSVAAGVAFLDGAVDDGGPAKKCEHPSDRSIAPDTAHKPTHRSVMQKYK
jgi:hypothetical protein